MFDGDPPPPRKSRAAPPPEGGAAGMHHSTFIIQNSSFTTLALSMHGRWPSREQRTASHEQRIP